MGVAPVRKLLLVSVRVSIVVSIGYLLFIIPGIIPLVFLSVSIPAVVEGQKRVEAMERSWSL